MKPNPVGWFELYVQDMSRAQAFYEAVLGGALQDLPSPFPEMEMRAFPSHEQTYGSPGSLVRMPGKDSGGGGTLIYFSCEDCAVQAARAAAHGGRVLKDKFPIGPYGHIALVHDTEGNTIGFHSMQ